MSSTVQDDPLRQEAREVLAEATHLGFIPYHASHLYWLLEENSLKNPLVIDWDTKHGSWRDFLQAGKAMGVQVFYIEIADFNLGESIQQIREGETEEPSRENTIEEEADRYQAYEGQVQELVLAYQTASTWHVYHRPADWFIKWQDLMERNENNEVDQEEAEELSEETLESYSRKLAQSLPFQRTSKITLRRQIAQRLFKDELERLNPNLEGIVDRASGILETEIRPSQEQALVEKARQLIEAGQTRSSVARKLNLTAQKLNRILSEFSH